LTDLRSKPLRLIKGALFLGVLTLAGGLLLARDPELSTSVLLAVVIWAAARSSDFLFYVLERDVDPRLRYSGLLAQLLQIRRMSGRRTGAPS
jgi:hypothetical protein